MLNPTYPPTSTLPLPATRRAAADPAPLQWPSGLPLKARRVLQLLDRLPHGRLRLTLPGGVVLLLGQCHGTAPAADLSLHDWKVIDDVLARGDVGLGEAYMDGDWSSTDLTALLRHFLLNRQHVEALVYGRWWGRLADRLRHLLRRNSRAGSRRNIPAHYDLGNSFYRLWLDAGMSYSSAWFRDGAATSMAQAQEAKFRRALDCAGVRPGDHVLEIGCGWGGLAELAARQYDARVTGITLSREQLAWATERLQPEIAAGRVQLRLQDYRDVHAPNAQRYDAIVSIEMFEAVGRAYWDGYFRVLARNLKADGRACIQSITIRDDLFDRYAAGTDFIQKHIFPGGMLPSDHQLTQHAEAAGLRVLERKAFGADYARTLRLWRASFEQQLDAIRDLGYDERFVRMWRFYLAYCEAGFEEGTIDVCQFTLAHAR